MQAAALRKQFTIWGIALVIWIIACAAIATWAEKKGRKGVGYFFLSFFLSPLLGLFIVAGLEDLTVKSYPYCKETIDANARVCPKCGKTIVISKKEREAADKDMWVSERIVALIAEGKSASDAKIQAEAEYTVNKTKEVQSDTYDVSQDTSGDQPRK